MTDKSVKIKKYGHIDINGYTQLRKKNRKTKPDRQEKTINEQTKRKVRKP